MKIALIEGLRVPEDYIRELAAPLEEDGHEFVYFAEKTTDEKELLERCQGTDIVMLANNPLPASVVEQLDGTQFINIAFTGVDHVPVDLAKSMGMKVSNAAGYANQAVAELAIGLTLALYREIKAGDQDVRQGEDFPGLIQGQEIAGKTVGIIGTGEIGLQTARLFKAFGANLIGFNRSEKAEAKELGIELKDLETVMQESDIISIHLPLNDGTKGIISRQMMTCMKPGAVLINVARGPVVDNEALADLLNDGVVAGAGIDVYDMEPPLPNDYPLLKAKNTILAPHVGYLTNEAMKHRARIVFENTESFIKGEPQNLV